MAELGAGLEGQGQVGVPDVELGCELVPQGLAGAEVLGRRGGEVVHCAEEDPEQGVGY